MVVVIVFQEDLGYKTQSSKSLDQSGACQHEEIVGLGEECN